MLHLFVPACFCLMTWSSVTGPEPTLHPTSIGFSKLLGESSETAGSAPRCEATVLPLAALHTLLKPIFPRSREEICGTFIEAARSNNLPSPFLSRLSYQESDFRPGAVSSAGALGIAQFMPETATDRGLDPVDPLQAILPSARLLRDLYRKFGNFGFAAAVYNAGSKRIDDWLAKKGPLLQETQDHAKAITGRRAETWTAAQAGRPAVNPQDASCQETAGLLAWSGPNQIPLPPRNLRAKWSLDHVTVAPQSADNKISDQKPAAESGAKAMPPQWHFSLSRLCSAIDRGAYQPTYRSSMPTIA